MTAMARLVRLATVLALASLAGGCGFILPDRIHYAWSPQAADGCADCVPTAGDAGTGMVGLALSGGGSRAAVFAAAVIEALDRRGLADRLTHISSVSGGGFAASYYAVNPPAAACPPGTGDSGVCRQAYFADFQRAMRADYTGAMLLNQLASPGRITSPTRRATSLQEALDAEFLHGITFGALPPQPVLLVNAASYDNGRRFVFANTVLDDRAGPVPPLSSALLRSSSFSRPDCAQATPADLPLSLAVVASAAFPPVLGPVTLQARRSCADPTPEYWHLGDGGIIDNTGADTLRELVARRAGAGGLAHALILIADSGTAIDSDASLAASDLSIFTSNPGAVVEIAQARGNAYAELFWAEQAARIGIPFDTIVFRYTDAELTAWPASCTAASRSGQSLAARLAAVPTALDIDDCDADLIAAAALDVVSRRLDQSGDILARHGLSPSLEAVALR
ncbi:MAG: patatin-like phospholipase family protein [Alphaproteobacteria bacterium]